MGYYRKTLHGLKYQTLMRASIRIIGFIKVALIARILGPVEFGIFGIATLLMGLLDTFTDTGINVFLIQEKNSLKKFLDSAFFVSLTRAVLIALVIVLLNPFVKQFFNIRSTTQTLLLVALISLLRGLINPAMVQFEKKFQFDKQMTIRVFLYLLDAIFSIYFCYKFRVSEAIFMGMIVGVFIEILISWFFIKPRAKLKLNISQLKYVFTRGKWITLTGIFNYLFHNLDDIFVGRILGVSSLGIYQLSYKLSTVPIYETGEIFGRVTLPVYSKISHSKERLKKAFTKVTFVISLLVIPLGILLIIFAKNIVMIFGNQWLEAVPVVRWLAFFGILRAITGSVTPLFYGIKKQEYAMNFILVGLIVLIITIYPLVKIYGIIGACISTIIATISTIPIIIFYLKKEFK